MECGCAIIYPGTAFCQVLCIKVITSRRAASVIAKFSLTNATYNFRFVDCSVILALKQRFSTQQSLSSLHLQLPQWFSNFFCHSPLLTRGAIQAPPVPHRSHKMVGQAPYLRATLPEGTQVQVWPDVISQSSPHLFSASLPVITSCPIQIKALKKKKKKKKRFIFNFF